jgi:hypothetical protein
MSGIAALRYLTGMAQGRLFKGRTSFDRCSRQERTNPKKAIMEHDRKGLLDIFIATTFFAGGLLASIFGRGKGPAHQRHPSYGCSVACPCGTI